MRSLAATAALVLTGTLLGACTGDADDPAREADPRGDLAGDR